MVVRPDMDRVAAVARGALPANMPAEQGFHQLRGAGRVAHGDIHVFDPWHGHGRGSLERLAYAATST